MKGNTLLAVVAVCVAAVLIALAVSNKQETVKVIHEPMTAWHDVLCIEEDGSAATYTIPVPVFEGFSDEFVEEYLEYSGQQFCDSIKDKTKYRHDVGEDK